MAENTSKELRGKVIYSVFVRNYSHEGTFKAVESDLDRIKSLGTEMIWFLPFYPSGKISRKGTLGSPYAIQNYREVDPSAGSLEDFKSLVNAAHQKGMKCLIDIVYNHTSPDSWLVVHHPEFFYRKPDGKMGNHIGEWTDVVDLDYSNLNLWDYQIETLKGWAEIVDGFRCDTASLVPLAFWKRARSEVAKIKPDFIWLAESVEPGFIRENRSRGLTCLSDSEIFEAFDISYDYDVFDYFTGYFSGTNSLDTYIEALNRQEFIYPENYVKLHFLENHDRQRAKHLIPDEKELINWTAFIYFLKGTVLIYAGQEVEADHLPSLFDRDVVNWSTGYNLSAVLAHFAEIKKNPVLIFGTIDLKTISGCGMVVGTRTWQGKKLTGIFSMKKDNAEQKIRIDVPDGIYKNAFNGKEISVSEGQVSASEAPLLIETTEAI